MTIYTDEQLSDVEFVNAELARLVKYPNKGTVIDKRIDESVRTLARAQHQNAVRAGMRYNVRYRDMLNRVAKQYSRDKLEYLFHRQLCRQRACVTCEKLRHAAQTSNSALLAALDRARV